MESMSNVPYYLDKARTGYRLGHGQVTDGLGKDGLWDVYNDYHMGSADELCADTCGITRRDQDAYRVAPYKRAQAPPQSGRLPSDIVPDVVTGRKREGHLAGKDE